MSRHRNEDKVIGCATKEYIVRLCLEDANGDLAEARRLVRQYVVGRAAQRKIIGAVEAAVEQAKAGTP